MGAGCDTDREPERRRAPCRCGRSGCSTAGRQGPRDDGEHPCPAKKVGWPALERMATASAVGTGIGSVGGRTRWAPSPMGQGRLLGLMRRQGRRRLRSPEGQGNRSAVPTRTAWLQRCCCRRRRQVRTVQKKLMGVKSMLLCLSSAFPFLPFFSTPVCSRQSVLITCNE